MHCPAVSPTIIELSHSIHRRRRAPPRVNVARLRQFGVVPCRYSETSNKLLLIACDDASTAATICVSVGKQFEPQSSCCLCSAPATSWLSSSLRPTRAGNSPSGRTSHSSSCRFRDFSFRFSTASSTPRFACARVNYLLNTATHNFVRNAGEDEDHSTHWLYILPLGIWTFSTNSTTLFNRPSTAKWVELV